MIILDLNQVMISNLMVQIGNHTNVKIEKDIIKHMIFNSIRSIKSKFSPEYGELVIACDNKNCWRKETFPYYKANRKKIREKSELNWNEIFQFLNEVRQDLKEHFPYRVIDIETAEADDIIASLVFKCSADQNILILSGDKDFIQLHVYRHVKQYDPVKKKFITHDDPEIFLKEHVLKGDTGDGVPNFLSSDNCLVVGERQKPLTSKRLQYYMDAAPDNLTDETLKRNYYRNLQLINLTYIPEELQEKVINEYYLQSGKNRNKIYQYFIKNRMHLLLENINDF
jgi:hypothetical protein